MRRYRALSRPPDAFCAGQSWADCITNTAGSDFRQGQALCGHDSGPFRSRPALSSSPPGLYCSECAGKADICTDLCLLQVTLLYHPLMELAGAFDAVVELTSAIRKLANNLVSPLGCHPEGISTSELNLLADSKPVRRHTGLHRSGYTRITEQGCADTARCSGLCLPKTSSSAIGAANARAASPKKVGPHFFNELGMCEPYLYGSWSKEGYRVHRAVHRMGIEVGWLDGSATRWSSWT